MQFMKIDGEMNKNKKQIQCYTLDLHQYIRMLEKISQRYAPSRILSFNIVHVFKTLQLIHINGYASRRILCKELALGEGVIKTLIKHLKVNGIIQTSNVGTCMTEKGELIFSKISERIPSEMSLPKCSIAIGNFNYVILLKQYRYAIKSGIEQRDCAIKMGALGATTLIFQDLKFVMPLTNFEPLVNEKKILKILEEGLNPEDGDVIIIGSDNVNEKTAELGAKNAALFTIINHEKTF